MTPTRRRPWGLNPRAVLLLALIALALVSALPAAAQPQGEAEAVDVQALSERLDAIESGLDARRPPGEDRLAEWAKALVTVKARGGECLARAEGQLAKVQGDLESLGEAAAPEPAEVREKRRALTEEKTRLEQRVSSCKVIALRAEDAQTRIAELKKQLVAQRVFARGPTLIEALERSAEHPGAWLRALRTFVLDHSGAVLLTPARGTILAVTLVLTLAVGWWLRLGLADRARRGRDVRGFGPRFVLALLATVARYFPHLLASGGVAVFFRLVTRDVSPTPFVAELAYGVFWAYTLVALTRLFLTPPRPAKPFLVIPPEVARALARRLKVLVVLLLAGYLLFATLLVEILPDPALDVARGVYGAALVLNLIWAVWLFGRIPRLAGTLPVRLLVHGALIGALAAEWIGYRNLSVATLRIVLGTLTVLGAGLLVARLLRELYDGLEAGRRPWHRRLRGVFRLSRGQHVPGLGWLRALSLLAVWVGVGWALLRLWGLSEAAMQQVRGYLLEGFTVGSLHISPTRIALALAIFVVLLVASGWLRARLDRQWLTKTRMERGARESLVTMTGYVGVAIALIVALAVAGFRFTNLAIIAGALSVGIGFGLQAIVNNFVSGLILLFERPVKTGDWVVVGSTEGYVKRIRIRSTQIETFDKADVIVPNSELIANQVTNWMFHNSRGRVVVAVGVAYGSDVDQVKRLLLEAARAHPEVVTDGTAPEPVVLFRRFGESSLDFELRCHIRQIDMRLSVISDLNFAIDAAFRRERVEIPFPQRDLRVRDLPRGWPPGGPRRPEAGD